MTFRTLMIAGLAGFAVLAVTARVHAATIPITTSIEAIDRMMARYGEANAARIRLGVEQVAQRWWAADGDADAFVAFCEGSFIADPAELSATFARLEAVLEQVDGHLHEVRRELTTPLDLDTGPVCARRPPARRPRPRRPRRRGLVLARRWRSSRCSTSPSTRWRERLQQGPAWDRETWARSRLMDRFAMRVPAAVSQGITPRTDRRRPVRRGIQRPHGPAAHARGETPVPGGAAADQSLGAS